MRQNKVEISGINTSELKLLTEAQKMQLLARAKAGDKAAREKLVQGNIRLVLSVIQRFQGRGDSPDDLFQVGCIGLIKAIDNFDMTHGVRFSTYAVPMIIGEIRRHLRDSGIIRVSRSLRDTAFKAMQTKEALQNKNGIEPTVSEIASALGMDALDVVEALESAVEPVSLYEPVFGEGAEASMVMDQIGDGDGEGNWISELAFKKALSELSPREKKILSERYILGRTQVEVAKRIGISQAQVSRLEKGALSRIKQEI